MNAQERTRTSGAPVNDCGSYLVIPVRRDDDDLIFNGPTQL